MTSRERVSRAVARAKLDDFYAMRIFSAKCQWEFLFTSRLIEKTFNQNFPLFHSRFSPQQQIFNSPSKSSHLPPPNLDCFWRKLSSKFTTLLCGCNNESSDRKQRQASVRSETTNHEAVVANDKQTKTSIERNLIQNPQITAPLRVVLRL